MKKKTKDLDVDHIGGQDAPSPEEEKAIKEYFSNRNKSLRSTPRKTGTNKKKVKA